MVVPRPLIPAFEWVHGLGVWGLVVLAAAYVPSALVAFPPAFLLTIAAGALYEVVPATIAISLGSTFAATCAFLLGRTLARGWVEARMEKQPLFKALDTAVAESGFKIVLLTRLSPLLPYFLLNYAYGITKVRLRDFVLASWIGMLPGTLLYVYIGATVGSAAALAGGTAPEAGLAGRVFWWVGLGATVLVTFLVTRQARRALQQALRTTRTTTGDPRRRRGECSRATGRFAARRVQPAAAGQRPPGRLGQPGAAAAVPPRRRSAAARPGWCRAAGAAGLGAPRRPGRARPARRRLPQRRLRAVQGGAPRRPRRRRGARRRPLRRRGRRTWPSISRR